MPIGKEKILVVDDDPDILTATKYLLERHYQTVVTCNNPQNIPRLLADSNYDAILLDMNFRPGESDGEVGLQWLGKILDIDPDAVVVIITAHGNVDIAVEAMKRGAIDYLAKPWDNTRLAATLSAAVKLRHSRSEAARLKQSNQALTEVAGSQGHTIIGASPAMQEVMSLVSRAAPTDANVLILGENGTGKELIAREIHRQSKRHDRVFIPVDLGSISETLFESELFGYRKGAFTGAKENRIGYIEAADGGSLFLDEIGNLQLHLQTKLLSVLEKREVSMVGSSTASPVDLRIIAATNMPLKKLNNPRHFRQDLLFRINTVEINLPPLRDRTSDIPDIARHFLALYCHKYGKTIKKISPDAMAALVRYQWPGNVRALRHAMERAVILSTEDLLTARDFQFHEQYWKSQDSTLNEDIYQPATVPANPGNREIVDAGSASGQELNLEQLEYRAIMEALRKNHYVISNAAKDLGLTRAALYRRMVKYGI